jgi:[ribosomal protein S5]-alanine N-acetyltransferase
MKDFDVQPPLEIETDRLMLRAPRIEDAQPIFGAYANDPEVTHFLAWPPATSSEEVEEFLRTAIQRQKDRMEFYWIIERKDTGEPIGMISFEVSEHGPELGYVLARAHWGRGYMSEVAGALTRWLLSQPSIDRVWAVCDVGNVGSRRVLEKVGMDREGCLRRWAVEPNISDRPRDMYVYSAVK